MKFRVQVLSTFNYLSDHIVEGRDEEEARSYLEKRLIGNGIEFWPIGNEDLELTRQVVKEFFEVEDVRGI